MAMRIYQRLSRVYDLDWGKFSERYVSLIGRLLNQRGIGVARILDLACGTGTLALELARRGHQVRGTDISPEMIEKARSKSVGLSSVSFEVEDMAEFSADGKFDLVTCTFDSVNYLLNPDKIEEMLSRISAVLRESGVFVFDSNTDRLYTNRHSGVHRRDLGDESFIQRCSYDAAKLEATTVFEFSDGSVEIHRQRPYDLPELEPLLAGAGLRVVHSFADLDGRPFGSEDERLICVAEKASVEKDL